MKSTTTSLVQHKSLVAPNWHTVSGTPCQKLPLRMNAASPYLRFFVGIGIATSEEDVARWRMRSE